MTKKPTAKTRRAEHALLKAAGGHRSHWPMATLSARRFYADRFTAQEAGLLAEFISDPSLDDEIWLQRVLNHRLLEHGQMDDVELLVKVMQGVGSGATRVGRLLRDKRALSGEAGDGLAGLLAAALDEIGTELGLLL